MTLTIRYFEDQSVFHLQSKHTSYLLQIKNGYPVHLYWGKKIRMTGRTPIPVHMGPDEKNLVLDRVPQEYPQYGTSDFRSPAYQVELDDGSRITELQYKSHRIISGKPELEGLPAVYTEEDTEAETLELELHDAYSDLTVYLSYTVFAHSDAIARSARFVNQSGKAIRILRAMSANVDLPGMEYEAVHLSGAWGREAMIQRRPIGPGATSIDSTRGVSSHQANPFFALAEPGADEEHGNVYAFSLIYSGNFLASAEVDSMHNTRAAIGLNPFDFAWKLEPGESFQTPEAIMVFSAEGLGGMSREFHRLYRTRLCRGLYRDQPRPILVNNWEGTYFNFTEDKLLSIAETASQLGIELFVLDDGWFGKRDNDRSSLGDWFVYRDKLPNGLENLANRVNEMGVKFGLWVEPEMVSPDSELYRKHPDWCIHVEGRRRTEARWQLILDYSRPEVRDYIFELLSDIFTKVNISYIKWDMNRNMTEIGSPALPQDRQKELPHRYVLGLYELLERFTTAFPHILFESCSSGGGRFDPGMLYYMPQTWTSDNTDAVTRLKIQYGTSLVYPISSIGAHVSAVPNHQEHRITPLETRGDTAMSGNFGYELDLTLMSDAEKEIVIRQVATYKEIRELVQQGDLYRLKSPFEGNETAWMFVSNDKREAIVFYFRVLSVSNFPQPRLKLRGLDPNLDYVIDSDEQYGGDLLMNIGLVVPELRGDFKSVMFRLKAAEA